MTRRNMLRSVGALALAGYAARAADLNGRWKGTAANPERTENVLLILRVNGADAAGSLGPDEDRRFPIEQGKVEGNTILFHITGPNGALFQFKLTMDGDRLRGTCSRSLDGKVENATIELTRVS